MIVTPHATTTVTFVFLMTMENAKGEQRFEQQRSDRRAWAWRGHQNDEFRFTARFGDRSLKARAADADAALSTPSREMGKQIPHILELTSAFIRLLNMAKLKR